MLKKATSRVSVSATSFASCLAALSVRTFEALRLRGGGPPYVKLGRAVRYRRDDVLAWAAGKLRRSTSDTGEAADDRAQ